jgi:hypothetical protein
MAKIQIRFLSQKDFISTVIEFVEGGSEFCHVEFVFSKDEQTALGIAGPYVGSHSDAGIQAYNDSYYVGGKTITRERNYSLSVTDEQYVTITSFIKSRIGAEYDFQDILGIMLHKDWHTANRFICSAFVIAALWAGGVQMLNVLPGYQYKVTPESAHLSSLLIGNWCSY